MAGRAEKEIADNANRLPREPVVLSDEYFAGLDYAISRAISIIFVKEF